MPENSSMAELCGKRPVAAVMDDCRVRAGIAEERVGRYPNDQLNESAHPIDAAEVANLRVAAEKGRGVGRGATL